MAHGSCSAGGGLDVLRAARWSRRRGDMGQTVAGGAYDLAATRPFGLPSCAVGRCPFAVRGTTRRAAPSASASAAMSGNSGRTWLAVNRRRTLDALRLTRRASSALDMPRSTLSESRSRITASVWASSRAVRSYARRYSGSCIRRARRRSCKLTSSIFESAMTSPECCIGDTHTVPPTQHSAKVEHSRSPGNFSSCCCGIAWLAWRKHHPHEREFDSLTPLHQNRGVPGLEVYGSTVSVFTWSGRIPVNTLTLLP